MQHAQDGANSERRQMYVYTSAGSVRLRMLGCLNKKIAGFVDWIFKEHTR